MSNERKNETSREYQRKRGEDYAGYSVYILPEEHYVGMTKNVYSRMLKHKHKGKNTEGWILKASFDNPIEAHIYETQLHLMGFFGFRF